MISLIPLLQSLSSTPATAVHVASSWFFQLQLGRVIDIDSFYGHVLTAILALGVFLLVLVGTILGKSWVELRRDQRDRAIRRSVRQEFYKQLADPHPDWESLVASFSDIERDVLVEELSRSTKLLEGSKTADLRRLAETLGLREEARAAIDSDSRYRRLWGLKLFIQFGWSADPEWLTAATSQDRDEGEAAIHVLANSPDRITRLAGIELALQFDGLSVYGMQALHRLVRSDSVPLLEQLDRQEISDSAPLSQLLRILARSDTFTGEAPMDGVLQCLDHDSPSVRRAACSVLAEYGWRPDVRDRVDLLIADLFDDPSTAVRIEAYRMLGQWDDAAAQAKLSKAADSETDSRALYTLAAILDENLDRRVEQDETGSIHADLEPLGDVGEIGPNPTRFSE